MDAQLARTLTRLAKAQEELARLELMAELTSMPEHAEGELEATTRLPEELAGVKSSAERGHSTHVVEIFGSAGKAAAAKAIGYADGIVELLDDLGFEVRRLTPEPVFDLSGDFSTVMRITVSWGS